MCLSDRAAYYYHKKSVIMFRKDSRSPVPSFHSESEFTFTVKIQVTIQGKTPFTLRVYLSNIMHMCI